MRFVNDCLRRPLGSMPLRILTAAVTLVALGIVIASVLHFQQERHKIHYSKALVIAEYGLQQALENLQRQPSWTEGFRETPYSKGSYAVSMQTASENGSLRLHLTSIGRSGPATRSKDMDLELAVQGGDSAWIPIGIR
jgi:hypothetical protein